MITSSTSNEVAQLRSEVSRLREIIDHLMSGNAELTVRRFAVSDGLGERIVLTADTMGEARVDVLLAPESHTTASLYAEPTDAGSIVGVAVWAEGNHRASLAAVDTRRPYDESRNVWDVDLSLDYASEPFVSDSVTLSRDGVQVEHQDLRGIELPIRRRDAHDEPDT